MKHTNKKGFTIVELVIVIAVIAILAAVLIPTFSNLIKKANISNDTAIAKNLNTAAISAQADTFGQAIEAAKEAGYLVGHLNAKADNIYFVWDDSTNQFLLYDLKAGKVLYSNTKEYSAAGENWYFTVNTKAEKDAVLAAFGETKVNCNYLVGEVAALKEILAAGGEVYIDESLVLDADNRLEFVTDGANVEINLGSAQLTSNGVIANKFPIDIKKGTVVINGGVVGALGSDVDLDGKVYSTPINSDEGTNVTLNGTEFNGDDIPVQFRGVAELNNVKVNGGYLYSVYNGQVTLNNCEVYCGPDVAIWVTNTRTENGTTYYDGTSTMTINSGKYESGITDANWGAVSVHDGTIKINGGEFISAEGHMFGLIGTTCPKIVITGGTFNNATFDELVAAEDSVKAWKDLCAGDYDVAISVNEEGKTVVTITP